LRRRSNLLGRDLGGFARRGRSFDLCRQLRSRRLRQNCSRPARNCVRDQWPGGGCDEPSCRRLRSRSWSSRLRRSRWGGRFRNSSGGHRNRRPRSCSCGSFGLFAQGCKHVPRLGDVREIDLCLDLLLAGAGTTVSSRCCTALPREVLAHTFGFIEFNRTRVRLLFRYSDFGKNVENCPALDFQFPGQIVDSNFTH